MKKEYWSINNQPTGRIYFIRLLTLTVFCVVFVLATNITVSASSNVEKENIFMDEVESSNVLSEATSTQILEDGVYYIRVWSSLDYLSVPNYNANNSANVACTATRNSDWSVTNEKNQIWLLTHLGDNKYSIRPIMKPDMGLRPVGYILFHILCNFNKFRW